MYNKLVQYLILYLTSDIENFTTEFQISSDVVVQFYNKFKARKNYIWRLK